ncbi:hypothetical protein YN1_3900 [Nanoarchaeota archaeon]
MRALGLKDIIEYILAAVIVVVFTILLIFFYGFYETEQYNLQSYEIFYQSLLVDRLNYCLYKYTGNPYYLFYAPSNSTLQEYWNKLEGCFMNYSGFFEVPIQYYKVTSNVNGEVEENYTIEYANLSYVGVPYLIFYNINNLSKSYIFYYNQTFSGSLISNNYLEASAFLLGASSLIISTLATSYVSPPSSVNVNNNNQLYSLLSQYLLNESNYTEQLLQNITAYNNTFEDFYKECVQNGFKEGIFMYPMLSKSIFEVNYNGEPINIGVYQFGLVIYNKLYNATCEYINGKITNNCDITTNGQ